MGDGGPIAAIVGSAVEPLNAVPAVVVGFVLFIE